MTKPAPKNALPILIGYILAVLLLGALLAPPLFWAGKALAQAINSDFLKQTAFVSYYDRAALLVALLGLPMLFKAMQLQLREVIGTVPLVIGWKQLLLGFFLALTLIILMGIAAFDCGVFKMAKRPPWEAVFMPLLSGFSVAFIEEFLFRGAIFSVLTRSLGTRGGIFWTTVLFAIVHFLKPPAHEALVDAEVTWTSGLWVVTQLFRGFASMDSIVPEFLLLTGVGGVLALTREATNGLWASIGLHAGWVAGMKYFSALTITTKALRAGEFAPWMVENHCKAIVSSTVGLVPLVAVLITGALMLGISKIWRNREI